MGFFDRTICDCCVCPMQSVLQQVELRNTEIFNIVDIYGSFVFDSTIQSVEDFLLITDNFSMPIHSIFAFSLESVPSTPFTIKDPKKDNKGECACIEDPAAKMLQDKINQFVIFSDNAFGSGNSLAEGTLKRVGEGIAILEDPGAEVFGDSADFVVVNTCLIGVTGFFDSPPAAQIARQVKKQRRLNSSSN